MFEIKVSKTTKSNVEYMNKRYIAPSVIAIEVAADTLLAGSGVYDGSTILGDDNTTSTDNITCGEAKQSGGIWDDEE